MRWGQYDRSNNFQNVCQANLEPAWKIRRGAILLPEQLLLIESVDHWRTGRTSSCSIFRYRWPVSVVFEPMFVTQVRQMRAVPPIFLCCCSATSVRSLLVLEFFVFRNFSLDVEDRFVCRRIYVLSKFWSKFALNENNTSKALKPISNKNHCWFVSRLTSKRTFPLQTQTQFQLWSEKNWISSLQSITEDCYKASYFARFIKPNSLSRD